MRARLVHGRLSAVREGPRNASIPRASVLRLLVFPDGNCKLRAGGEGVRSPAAAALRAGLGKGPGAHSCVCSGFRLVPQTCSLLWRASSFSPENMPLGSSGTWQLPY